MNPRKKSMKRGEAKTVGAALGDEALSLVAGGAKSACDTLHDLAWSAQARGDMASVAFFDGAMEGAGCFK